tara:strand:- start:193 stop:693 length:501 start_codon:yes stop_codon:yes gene_type:complete
MSENATSESAVEISEGLFNKVSKFLTSKKGMYLVGAIVLIGAIYYYTQCYNKKKENKKSTNNTETEIPEPPPGYVTVPVEMLQGLQQDQMYQEVPPQMNQQMQQLPQQYQQQMPQAQDKVPQLRHNNSRLEEDEEEEEIANQNLSKDDMESIQAQLNAMQREGASA